MSWTRYALLALTACNAVAGLGDLEFDPSGAGSSGGGGSGGLAMGGGAGEAPCPEDVSRDPEHCGACNHSCLGGACENGQCQPLLIAEPNAPLHVAVNDSHIFWTAFYDGGHVARLDRSTGVTALLHQGAARPAYLFLTDTHLYWTEYEGNTVMRSALDGTNPETLAQAPDVDAPFGIAVGGDTVYWVNRATDSVLSVSASSGGNPTVITDLLVGAEGLWLHDDALYIADEEAQHVIRWPLPNGPAEVVTDGLSDPVGVAADSDYVYVTDQSEGALLRVPQPTGTRVALVVDDMATAGGVFIDDQAIWWTYLGGDKVMMLAK